eukprot:4757635-Amphidinium_carterae.1
MKACPRIKWSRCDSKTLPSPEMRWPFTRVLGLAASADVGVASLISDESSKLTVPSSLCHSG